MQVDLGTFYARLGAIALIMLLGYFLGKKKLLSSAGNRELVNLLLSVFMPASLFMAFPATYSKDSAALFFAGLVGGIIVMLMLVILSKILFNKYFYKGKLRYEVQFALIFNNATFLGYPIIASTFDSGGVIAYCGFIIAFNVALFSYGVYLFTHQLSGKLLLKTAINPNILAVLAGMIIFLTGFSLPSFVSDAISFVGGATTPLSIICIGFMLSRANFKKLIRKWHLVIPAFIQLIIGPVATYFTLTLLRFPAEVVSVCTLIEALPTATSLSLFATKYGGNDIESSELVAISTAISVATLPVIVYFFM